MGRRLAFLILVPLAFLAGLFVSGTIIYRLSGHYDPARLVRTTLKPFQAQKWPNGEVQVKFDSDVAMFVFDPRSPRAPDNVPYWNSICRESGIPCFGIAVDSSTLGEFVNELELEFPVLQDVPASFIVSLGVFVSPLTVYVRQGGNVGAAWYGHLGRDSVREEVVTIFFAQTSTEGVSQ